MFRDRLKDVSFSTLVSVKEDVLCCALLSFIMWIRVVGCWIISQVKTTVVLILSLPSTRLELDSSVLPRLVALETIQECFQTSVLHHNDPGLNLY